LLDTRDPDIVGIDLRIPERAADGTTSGRMMSFAFDGPEGARAREWALLLADTNGAATLAYVQQCKSVAESALADNEVLRARVAELEARPTPEDPRYTKLVEALKKVGFNDPERLIQ